MGKADLHLDFIDHKAAKFAVQNWHYSRAMPSGKLVKIGVWEMDRFVGAVIFGRGASPHLGTSLGLGITELCELVRVALSAREAQVSRIVAIAIRKLRRYSPGIRCLVSFADPSQGHHGGIYQAMGWTFTGQSNETTLHFWKGRWRHTRSIAGTSAPKGQRAIFESGAIPTKVVPGKYRYLLPLDDELRPVVRGLALPYPKRDNIPASESSTCPASQSGSGRSSTDPDAPTPA